MQDNEHEPAPDRAFTDDLPEGVVQPLREGLDEARDSALPQSALALDEDDRLPWLESADDEDDEAAVDGARLVRFALFGLAVLALVAGALWFINSRASGPVVAEGGVITAPATPYKEVPKDTGGKTYAGTGDSAFAVSAGKNPAARLGDGGAPAPAPAPATASTPAAEGIGVQVGAYSSLATAEAGWTRLQSANEALKTAKHRVVEGSADIGTVYRLQALAPDIAAANALCTALKANGTACQVKR